MMLSLKTFQVIILNGIIDELVLIRESKSMSKLKTYQFYFRMFITLKIIVQFTGRCDWYLFHDTIS